MINMFLKYTRPKKGPTGSRLILSKTKPSIIYETWKLIDTYDNTK